MGTMVSVKRVNNLASHRRVMMIPGIFSSLLLLVCRPMDGPPCVVSGLRRRVP